MHSLKATRLWAAVVGVMLGIGTVSTGETRAQDETAAPPPAAPSPAAGDAQPVASPNEPVVKIASKKSSLKIIKRFSQIIEFDAKILSVDGFDSQVCDVMALTANRLRIQAVETGITTMTVFDENQQSYSIEIFVIGDVRHLQAYLDQLFPDSAVEAVALKDSVVLRGFVARPEHITSMMEIAEAFSPHVINQISVGGGQQVMMQVKVMEIQRAKLRKLGLNFLYQNENGYFASTPGNLAPVASIDPPNVTVNPARLLNSTLFGGIVSDDQVFQAFIEALKQESLLKILAEPKLVSTNGRPAHMLAGGEFPLPVPQSLGTTTIEWHDFGVRLEAVPIILGHDRVRLELQPEVSERDFTNSVTIGGIIVPALTSRRVNTQVEMNFGETFVLAGLISLRETASTSKVPLLGELPWIGPAFRRVSYEEGETELVIMVTPELVSPLKANEVPDRGPGENSAVPTDRELYNGGLIEVPYYGDICQGCSAYEYPNGGNMQYEMSSPTAPMQPNSGAGLIPPAAEPTPAVSQGGRILPPPAPGTGPQVKASRTKRPASKQKIQMPNMFSLKDRNKTKAGQATYSANSSADGRTATSTAQTRKSPTTGTKSAGTSSKSADENGLIEPASADDEDFEMPIRR